MNIVSRAQNMILRPAYEWPVVAAEPLTTQQILVGYVAPLAAIGPVCAFIGSLIHPAQIIQNFIFLVIVGYIASVVGVFIGALVVNLLAQPFGGQPNFDRAFKLVAFGSTPFFVAAAFQIIPFIGAILALAGLYGFYVIYLGIAGMMYAPPQKAVPYTATYVGIEIVIGLVFGGIVAAITFAMLATAGHGHHRFGDVGDEDTGATVASVGSFFGAKPDAARALQDSVNAAATASAEVPSSSASMDPTAAMAAGANVLKAFVGGGHTVTIVPRDQLAALLPTQLADMARTGQNSSNTAMSGFNVSQAEGDYQASAGTVKVEIADLGNASSLLTMMNSAMGMVDSDDDNGFEKTVDLGGQRVHETWKSASKHSEIVAIVANRFTVTLTGDGVDMGTTEKTLASLDLGKLGDLATAK